ncbi:hypothetical protein [Marinifilum sp.]|uniref:hypothetical protein n=1 Tax=Marinifilum sp. TaxID=2033137 RepID=UPI003BAB27F5
MKSKSLRTIVLCCACLFGMVITSCDNDDTLENVDNYIVSFNLTINGEIYPGLVNNDQNIVFIENVETNADLKNADFIFNLSTGASISPDPSSVTNWENPVDFTITAENGSSRKYQISVKRIGESTNNSINSFSILLNNLKYWGVIDHEKNTINVNLPSVTDIQNLTNIEYTIAQAAQINPSPAEIKDWSKPIETTVIAQNGDERTYTIAVNTISDDMDTGNLLSSLSVQLQSIKYWASINHETKIAELILPDDADLSNLPDLEYTISKNASTSLADMQDNDWTLPKEITVISADGTENKYTVIITKVSDHSTVDNLLTSFYVLHNSLKYWGVIDHENGTVKVKLPMDAELGNVENVDFSISKGASISPNPKEIIDWSAGLAFRVSSKTNSKDYVITIEKITTAQTTFVGDITFTSQKQLKEFGKLGYTKIIGNVELNGDEAYSSGKGTGMIYSLSPLLHIEEIVGDLRVIRCDKISSFEGLKNLKTIGGSLYVSDNDGLYDFTDLENLEAIERNLYINMYGGNQITDLSFLKNLKNIGGDLTMDYSGNNFKGLEKLEEIGGEFEINGENITSLEGLEMLKSVNRLSIYGTNITSLKGLENFTSIYNISIESCPKLVNLEGFNNVTSITFLRISNNAALTDLDALNSLTWCSGISIIDNAMLKNINGLSNVSNHTSVELYRNPVLQNVDGLKGIEECSTMIISENEILENIDGISSLKKVNNILTIGHNNNITNINALSGLTEIGTSISIQHNAKLDDISGLSNLTTIGEHLSILYNNISNLDALTNLKTLKGDLWIQGNTNLNDFCGLKTLATEGEIGGSISISENKYNPSMDDIKAGDCSL